MALDEKQTRKYGVSTTEKDEPSSKIFSRFKDPAYRSKFFRWLWLPCAMFTLGVVVSQGGPTLLDLRIITDTDEETGSFFFTSISGGYLLGSIAAGAVHGKINNNVIMAAVTILGGATTIATPYCSNFILMVSVRAIVGFFLGSIDCTINAEHMRIWGIEGQALLQFVHFSFAIGGVIGPLFSAPFLAEKLKENTTTSEQYPNVTQSTVAVPTDDTNTTLPHTTEIHYAYLIAGIIMAVAAIPFLAMLLMCNKSDDVEKEQNESPQRKLPVDVVLFLVTIICAYYIMYCCVENTFSSFLETFLVDEYPEVTKADAAYITTYFWAAFAVGRFGGIFTSKFLSPARVLYMHLSLMIISFSGFLISALYARIDALTAFTCLVGVSMSSVYPAGISWVEKEILKVTGRIAGVILVGSSAGSMANPYIVGYLMQHKSNFWYCYFQVGAVGVTCSLFVFMLFFNRLYVNEKYGKFNQIVENEKQINLTSKGS